MESSDKYISPVKPHSCCPSHGHNNDISNGLSRRKFIKVAGGSTLSVVALSGLSWQALAGRGLEEYSGIRRQPLLVKPILVYSTPEPKHQSSWRSWGGIQTKQDAEEEISRINGELKKIKSDADFPLDFLPVAGIRGSADIDSINDIKSADTLLIYAAG